MKYPERPNATTTVIASTVTGSVWGGVWGDPTSVENIQKERDICEHTGEEYEIMSFLQAKIIRLANRQKANLKTK